MAYSVANGGIFAGVFADRPAAAVAGRLYLASDLHIVYRDNGASWDVILGPAELVNALGNVTGATEIDWNDGQVVTATVTGAVTWTFANPPATGYCGAFTLRLTNGGSAAQTWPASVDWPGGSVPTLTAAGLDILVFHTIDGGTTWAGFIAATDVK